MKGLLFGKAIERFRCRQDGTATIEVVLWIPIVLVLVGILADTSIVFGRQAEILRIIQDGNRSLAVGRFQTTAEAETYILDRVSVFSDETTVDVIITDGIIATSVTVPVSDLTSTGLFEAINSLTFTIGASQMSEI